MKLYEIDKEGNYELFKNEQKYERVTIPSSFASEFEKSRFWKNEIKKCKHGDGIVPGKFYFWFNFCRIKGNSRGMIRPDFMMWQVLWFALLEFCVTSGKGIICVKRRRAGASWLMAADALHDGMFSVHKHIGMNSKTEKDSEMLFERVKFLYQNLPEEIRPTTAGGNTQSSMFFGYKAKDRQGNTVRGGNQTTIEVVAPVPTAYEGRTLSKWIADEAGKTEHLKELWDMTEPCLMDESGVVRVGVPVVFGTAGQMSHGGSSLREMYNNYRGYNLIPFFISGTTGVKVDAYGNDDHEEALKLRNKLVEQARLKGNNSYISILQQYPLNEQEAFMDYESDCLYDKTQIVNCIQALERNPPSARTGNIERFPSDTVFRDSPTGMVTIYEMPEKDIEYFAGTDPTDTDNTGSRESKNVMYIAKAANGSLPPVIICEISFKPGRVSDFYEQCLGACLMYNNAKNMIERNRGGRMIAYYETLGFKNLLCIEPAKEGRMFRGRVSNYGYHRTDTLAKNSIYPLTKEYVQDHCSEIPSITLLTDLANNHGVRNADFASAFEALCIHMKERQRGLIISQAKKSNTPTFGYKIKNGVLTRQ
jgi:hypothetical protein